MRQNDRYLEVHIYGELSWQTLAAIILARPMTTAEEQDDWSFGRQKLERRNVKVVDPTNP
ncbi:MAG: hypothetical protein WA268_24305 [Xanthobacteraceae bacterium]